MFKIDFPEDVIPVQLLEPAADAAGRTSAVWLKLDNAQRLIIVVHIAQGNAATIALTPLQATAPAGTGSKVLTNNVPIWSNLDAAAGDALTRRTDAKNYTTDAGVKNKVVVFVIDPELLDSANSFNCVGISTGASNVANITQAMGYIQQRYQQPTPVANYSQ